jgi:cellulose synthase/poly-beta-1,6-N-acetylglucosamine synthase-like glycosyltransferase
MTGSWFNTSDALIQLAFWLIVAFVTYTYLGYPALVGLMALIRPRPVRMAQSQQDCDAAVPLPTVSVVLAVHNEERTIGLRLKELVEQIARHDLSGEVIVVSDGSTDRTIEVTRAYTQEDGLVPVRMIALSKNVGKAAALTAGCQAARSEIIAMADARQTWSSDALPRLLENFNDEEVGAVSGELVVESEPGVMASVGLYWRYEKWLRRREALVHSSVGLTGAICAVRRELFRPIPVGTLLDDVYWPLQVAMQGYRVVFDTRARAFDRLPARVSAEFRRKVRTLSGNFQLLVRLPDALLPWRNPVWVALVSHKLARLAIPWAWLAALGLSAIAGGSIYSLLFVAQLAVTMVGLAGLCPAVARRSRVVSAAGSLLILNVAAACSLLVWLSGRASRTWTKTMYHPPTNPRQQLATSFAGAGQ